MMDWYLSRSQRERMLLAIMAILLGVLLFSLLIIRPLNSFKANAEQNVTFAETTKGLVDQAVANAGANASSETSENIRRVVTLSAQGYGLRWINIRAGDADDVLTISFANVPAEQVFAWLSDLEEKQFVVATEARITKSRNAGGVDATFTFARR